MYSSGWKAGNSLSQLQVVKGFTMCREFKHERNQSFCFFISSGIRSLKLCQRITYWPLMGQTAPVVSHLDKYHGEHNHVTHGRLTCNTNSFCLYFTVAWMVSSSVYSLNSCLFCSALGLWDSFTLSHASGIYSFVLKGNISLWVYQDVSLCSVDDQYWLDSIFGLFQAVLL